MQRDVYKRLTHNLREYQRLLADAQSQYKSTRFLIDKQRVDGFESRIARLKQVIPVGRDPLGFRIMHENWMIRRAHVMARVRQRRMERIQRERDAMVREPGESLIDYVSRKTGFVKDTYGR